MVRAAVIASWGRRAALAAAMLLAPAGGAMAGTIPPIGNYLTGFGSNGLSFITDGTSNTIQFNENSTFAVCLDQVSGGNAPLPSITDGSSNTLLFGDGSVRFLSGRAYPRVPINQITDGSSNTIIIGERTPDSICLGDNRLLDPPGTIPDGSSNTIIIGEGSEFDVCFRNVRVGTIVDGTSNTIQFGEVSTSPVCYDDVRLPVAEVAEPAMAPALALGLVALAATTARRRRRSA